jgi:hypothetical protein
MFRMRLQNEEILMVIQHNMNLTSLVIPNDYLQDVPSIHLTLHKHIKRSP